LSKRGILCGVSLGLVALWLVTPALADRFKLSDALALTYTSNPELLAQRAKVRQADDGVAEAKGNMRPNLNGSASFGYQRFDATPPTFQSTVKTTPLSGRTQLSQPVFTGGQGYAQIQRAIALVRSARADLLNAEQQILLAAATAYLDVVRDTENLRLHQSDVDVLVRQRNATKTQLDAGEATKTDLQEVEVRIAGAQADLALAQSQLAQSRDGFERIIGRAAETLEDAPPPPRLPGSEDQALAIALKLNPRIQSAEAQDKAAKYGVDNAIGAMLPHASIVAEYDYNQGSFTDGFGQREHVTGYSLLGQLSIPLYQGGSDDARVREAKEARSQTRFGMLDADQATRQSLRDSWSAYHSASSAVGYNQSRVGAAGQALDGVIQQQHQGERSILDILNAEQEKLQAQLALAGARHDMVVTAFQTLAATGQLTAKYLALNVKLYDPDQHYDERANAWIDFGDSDE
jgi:outer membrane protein